jgi:hypothetical protein
MPNTLVGRNFSSSFSSGVPTEFCDTILNIMLIAVAFSREIQRVSLAVTLWIHIQEVSGSNTGGGRNFVEEFTFPPLKTIINDRPTVIGIEEF